MVKAVFFDLYQTLVRYEPPREELHVQALKAFGIEAKPDIFRRPIMAADDFIYQEIARLPLSKRSEQEKAVLWAQYEKIVLKEAGLEPSDKVIMGLLSQMGKVKSRLVLFDDVMPALDELKKEKLTLGLISNVENDRVPVLKELGLLNALTIVVTSQDAGVSKPQPQIFLEALRQAAVKPSEAIYVGDQYRIDVIGANSVGMKGILLDRNGFSEVNYSPVIRSLGELYRYL